MKMIDGAASFACMNRSRTRDAPTPTIASTNSDAAIEKNGTSASPATARASSVLPVPGGPERSTPCGMRPPSCAVLVGVAQEVDDLGELLLRLVDAGDVGERHLVARRLVALRTRRGRSAEHALHVPRAPRDPDEEADEQDRRPEADEQLFPPRRARVERLRVDVTPLLCRSRESSSVFANAGISVLNRVVGFDFRYFTLCVNVPWIAVPFDMISLTVPARPAAGRTGCTGSRTRDCAWVARAPRQ